MNLLNRTTGWMRARLLAENTANRTLDDARQRAFLKWLNHELRTPLTALSAAAQVLEAAEPGSADAAEARAIILRQTQQLTRVVNELRVLYPEHPQKPSES